jgi:hypothetical protein
LETAALPAKILGLLVILALGLVAYSVFSYLLRLKELGRVLEQLKIKKAR